MSMGKIVYDGRLTLDIYQIVMEKKTIAFKAVARSPMKKDIPSKSAEAPYIIYCADGSIFGTGVEPPGVFAEARHIRGGGDLWMTKPITICQGELSA